MSPTRLLLVILVAGILGGGASDLTGFFRSVGQSAEQARADLTGTSTGNSSDCRTESRPITLRIPKQAPAIRRHVKEAVLAGLPAVITLDRKNAAENWRAATKGIGDPDSIDIWPVAASREAADRVSLRRVPTRQNRIAGRYIAQQVSGFCAGQRFQVRVP